MNIRQALKTKGWTRTVAVRRLVAGMLVALAAFLALKPSGPPDAPLLVADHDLRPGTTLSTSDMRVVRAPPALVPSGALSNPSDAVGQVLAGAASAGEPITAARLVGPANTRLTAGRADAAAVPIRLADDGVADLLTPGSRIDIVAPDQAVLAADATVVTVRSNVGSTATTGGQLVLVALPRDLAPRVAAASLARAVTVTLR